MTAFTQAFSSALLHFLWQGVIVAAALRLALYILRSRSATLRYGVSCASLLLLLCLPLATTLWIYQARLPVPPATGAAAASSASGEAWTTVAQAAAADIHFQAWVLPLWAAGVLLFSLRLLWACREAAMLARRGSPAEEALLDQVRRLALRIGLQRRVRLLISSSAESPSVVGWLRPVILLPAASVIGLNSLQLEAVLAHELAHIRRHDFLFSAAQVVVETLLFYHPAVWWVSAQVRHERELCCDDVAVSACGDALCYARALALLERMRLDRPTLAPAGTGGQLRYRIQRLLGVQSREFGPSRWSALLAVVFGVLSIAAGVNRAAPAQTEAHPAQVELRRFGFSVRDDAGVTVDLGAASLLHRIAVDYPEAAARAGVQGTVSVEASTDATGNVVDARILSGPSELRRVVLQSVLQWHFAAGSAQSTRLVTVAFDLAAYQQARGNRSESEAGKETFGVILRAQDEQRFKTQQDAAQAALRKKLELEGGTVAVQAGVMTRQAYSESSAAQLSAEDQHRLEEMRMVRMKRMAEAEAQGKQGFSTMSSLSAEDMARRKKAELETLQRLQAGGDGPETRKALVLSQMTLSGIRIEGIPEPQQQQLIAQLPVRVGDTLSKGSLEKVSVALRQFDEHLGFTLGIVNDREVELRIGVRR